MRTEWRHEVNGAGVSEVEESGACSSEDAVSGELRIAIDTDWGQDGEEQPAVVTIRANGIPHAAGEEWTESGRHAVEIDIWLEDAANLEVLAELFASAARHLRQIRPADPVTT